MKIAMRNALDPGGKPVDVIRVPARLFCFFMQRTESTSFKHLRPLLIEGLKQIRESPVKRTRDRGFILWYGSYTRRNVSADVLGFPENTSVRVTKIFEALVLSELDVTDMGSYSPEDCNAQPIFRYDHGRIIAYTDPFISREKAASDMPELEARSFEFEGPSISSPRKSPTVRPSGNAPLHHSIGSWLENRNRILEFVWQLATAIDFRSLKKVTKDHFGISVWDEPDSHFMKHAVLRPGFFLGRGACTVRILVARQLPEPLKAVVLGHEIAHYALHFPLLAISQLVEELAWRVPEWELLHAYLLSKHLGEDSRLLEEDANAFATYFLIPPKYFPLERMASRILEGGSSPTGQELLWRFLQPVFPETSRMRYSWRNWDKMKSRALRETDQARSLSSVDAGDLYLCILSGALSIENDVIDVTRREADAAVRNVWEDFGDRLRAFSEVSDEETRLALQKQYGGLAERRIRQEITAEVSSRGDLVPPLEWDGYSMYQRIPLVPAAPNATNRWDGDWRTLWRGNDSPAGTVEEWREYRRGTGLVLYPLETWERLQRRRSIWRSC